MIPQQGTLEISRSRLTHNIAALRKQLPAKTKFCATIKADAYGHGVALLAEMLHEAGVEWTCVYSLEEALNLGGKRFAGILVLSPLVLTAQSQLPRAMLDALRRSMRINLTDAASAKHLSRILVEHGIIEPVNVHVQVDAGLTRMGIAPSELVALAQTIAELPLLRLEGIFAHLSHGDVPGHETLEQQWQVLHAAAQQLRPKHPELMVHLQNSGGAFHVKEAAGKLDMARVGIAMYGLQPSTEDPVAGLLPIARLVALVLAIHERPAGVGVGYGHTFVTKRPTRLAIVPVGYADGYPRALSNRGVVQVRGQDAPVVGRVSMDQIIVDVTDVGNVTVGEEIVVISWDAGRPNSVDAIADAIGTIGYEVTTHFGARLRRVVVE